MAFAEDFNHLSLQTGNIKHKQQQKLAVQALQSGKYVMAMLVQLVSARPLFMRALSTDG